MDTVPVWYKVTFLSQIIQSLFKDAVYPTDPSCLTRCCVLLSHFTAPSSPPHALSVKQLLGVTVKLSWKPPLEPNGIILYYTVCVW